MPSRAQLELRARVVGIDPSTVANDSVLEQRTIQLEKDASTVTGAAGASTLTASGTPADGDTVTIGGRTYTFKTTLTGAANEVLINGSAANALINLKAAINGTGTRGTDYGTGTYPPTQFTGGTLTASTLVINPKYNDVNNTDIGTTKVGANLAWSGATLTGGSPTVVAAQTAGATGNPKQAESGGAYV